MVSPASIATSDPVERCVFVHAFNRWLLDQWTFNYEDALFAAPLITLSRLDDAMAELDWVMENGAKIIYIQPGFVVTDRGRTSMALPQFDPFWRKVEDYGVIVGMHSGDGGQTRYMNEWEGTPDQDLSYFAKRDKNSAAFRAFIGQYERLVRRRNAALGVRREDKALGQQREEPGVGRGISLVRDRDCRR